MERKRQGFWRWGRVAAVALAILAGCLASTAQAVPVLSGLELWLDASDASTFTFSSGSQVSQWRDKSDQGNHASTSSNFPSRQTGVIGGLPAVSFNRQPLTIAGGLDVAADQDRTAFVVMNYSASTNNSEILGTSTGNMVDVGQWSVPWRLRLRQTDNAFSAANSLPAGSHLVAITGDAAGSHAWRGGTSIIDTADKRFHWGMNANMQVGGAVFTGREYIGNLAELVVYDRALSDLEMNAVGYQLQEKYGLAGSYTKPAVPADGLVLWLDAGDASTLSLDASNRVTEWRDKTGNGHHATPIRAAAQWVPDQINGQAVIEFDQSARNAMQIAGDVGIASGQERTVFILFDYDTLIQNNEILGVSTGQMADVGWWTSSGRQDERLRLRDGSLNAFSGAGDVPLGMHILTLLSADDGTTALVDGELVIDATELVQHFALGTNLRIGGTDFDGRDFDGRIAEILLYNRALSPSEIRDVHSYLAAKYIPEPASLALVGLGALALLRRRRRGA